MNKNEENNDKRKYDYVSSHSYNNQNKYLNQNDYNNFRNDRSNEKKNYFFKNNLDHKIESFPIINSSQISEQYQQKKINSSQLNVADNVNNIQNSQIFNKSKNKLFYKLSCNNKKSKCSNLDKAQNNINSKFHGKNHCRKTYNLSQNRRNKSSSKKNDNSSEKKLFQNREGNELNFNCSFNANNQNDCSHLYNDNDSNQINLVERSNDSQSNQYLDDVQNLDSYSNSNNKFHIQLYSNYYNQYDNHIHNTKNSAFQITNSMNFHKKTTHHESNNSIEQNQTEKNAKNNQLLQHEGKNDKIQKFYSFNEFEQLHRSHISKEQNNLVKNQWNQKKQKIIISDFSTSIKKDNQDISSANSTQSLTNEKNEEQKNQNNTISPKYYCLAIQASESTENNQPVCENPESEDIIELNTKNESDTMIEKRESTNIESVNKSIQKKTSKKTKVKIVKKADKKSENIQNTISQSNTHVKRTKRIKKEKEQSETENINNEILDSLKIDLFSKKYTKMRVGSKKIASFNNKVITSKMPFIKHFDELIETKINKYNKFATSKYHSTSDKFSNLQEFNQSHLLVNSSQIHGNGLFSISKIHEDQRIIEYQGQIIGDAMANKLEKEYALLNFNSIYFFRLSKDRIIDATIYGNKSRYTNHSCQPNAEARHFKDGIHIFALKTIEPLEEITMQYNFSEGERIECKCKSANCVKFL